MSASVGAKVIPDRVYKSCILSRGGHECLANLIVINVSDFDVILGWIGFSFTLLKSINTQGYHL